MASTEAVQVERVDPADTHVGDIGRSLALVLLLAITVAGGVLRFWNLGADSIWYDEAVSWYQSKGTFSKLLEATALDNYPPLHNILLYFIVHIFGDSEWWLRFPSAVLGTALIPLTYWVAASLHSRGSGVLAATIVALSIFLIDFSQEARMYSLLALAATAWFGTMVRFLQRPSVPWGIAATLSGAALTYSHPYGGLTWLVTSVVFAIYALWPPRRSRARILGFLLVELAIVAIFLPWALILLDRARDLASSGFWIPYPTPELVLQQFQTAMGGQFTLLILGTGLAVVALWTAPRRENESDAPARIEPRWALAMLLGWALGPWVVAEIASLTLRPIVHERYLNAVVPAFCILAGIGLGGLVRSAAGVAAAAAALAVGLGSALFLWDGWHHDDWRSVAGLVSEELGPEDCAAIAPGYLDKPFQYYFRDESACVVKIDNADDADKLPVETKRIFVVYQYADWLRPDLNARLMQSWPNHKVTAFSGVDVETFEK